MPEHIIHLSKFIKLSQKYITGKKRYVMDAAEESKNKYNLTCWLILKSDDALFSPANNFKWSLPCPFVDIPFISPAVNSYNMTIHCLFLSTNKQQSLPSHFNILLWHKTHSAKETMQINDLPKGKGDTRIMLIGVWKVLEHFKLFTLVWCSDSDRVYVSRLVWL